MAKRRTSRTAGAAALVLCSLVALLAAVAPAGAQDPQDPYGSTSTSAPPARTATIEIDPTVGPVGAQVEVTACGYEPATTNGSITFGGTLVASDLVADAHGCLSSGGRRPTFRVPDDSRPGTHHVCAEVPGYNTPCARFRVENGGGSGGPDTDAEVLGNSVERPAGVDVFGASLPKTGIAAGAVVLLALVLIVGGRTMLEESRRRSVTRRR